MRKIYYTFIYLSAALTCVIPCQSQANRPLQVVVSILPQEYFVERIAGNLAGVMVMVPPGSNPATYEPRPTQMRALRHSRIYFAIGVPFEKVWLKKIVGVNPSLEVVHTDQLVEKRRMVAHYHDGGKDRESNVAPLDPHIWLSPPLVKQQARVIANALMKADPAHERIYRENLSTFHKELDQLHRKIRGIFEGTGRATEFLVFHPSWGYFAQAYGLTQIPVEVEGKEPSLTEMVRLVKYAKAKGIKVIFVQPQFATKSAEVIAREIDATVVIADPLHKDWAKNLRGVASKFREALR
jgi:zinc transport system substrate-binding protein